MKVLVIGGTGMIGSAAVSALSDHGDDVVSASRTSDTRVDITDPASIEALFASVGTVDAIVSAVGHVPFKRVADLTREDFQAGFAGKALSQMDVVRIGVRYLATGGSFTLTTGVLAREPVITAAVAAMANGAVEAFVMSAAADLPRGLRINVVSPTVLVENTKAHALFPGFTRVSAAEVGRAYVKTVHGLATGQTLKLDGR